MKFAKIYELLVNKAERKGRSKDEVDQLITWLCGYDKAGIQRQIDADVTYKTFFDESPAWNPNSKKITGKICGVQIEDILDPTMWRIRCLDKLVDELAKGKSLTRIFSERETNSKDQKERNKEYVFSAVIHENQENGGAYIIFPWDIRKEFGQGRIKVHAEFDGVPYDGSVVNMGVKDEKGNVCYVIGVLKSIRQKIGKKMVIKFRSKSQKENDFLCEKAKRCWETRLFLTEGKRSYDRRSSLFLMVFLL